MDNYEVVVKAPASTANLGPGFDTIGLALQLYTTVKMRTASKTYIYNIDDDLAGLPSDKNNLVYKVASFIFDKAGLPTPELQIEVESDIPLTRGLGSSAAAIVAGMIAANKLAGSPFNKDELYRFATEFEGHPDNVGASLLGGIVIATWDGSQVAYVRVPPPNGLKVVVAVPEFELSTKIARDALPESYSREDTVHAISHAALLAGALTSGNISVLYKAMDDRIHQPYRMSLIPGMDELLANCEELGALGVALSGAGPTVVALINHGNKQLENYMKSVLIEHGVSAKISTLEIDTLGASIL